MALCPGAHDSDRRRASLSKVPWSPPLRAEVLPFPPTIYLPLPPNAPPRQPTSPRSPATVFNPASRSVDTVPPPLDQYFAYIFHLCTVEGLGRPAENLDAFRRAVLWYRSHSATSGSLDAICLLEIHVSEMSEQAHLVLI